MGFVTGGALSWTLGKLFLTFFQIFRSPPLTAWPRLILLVSAITLHNDPKGSAVGVAFGGAMAGVAVAVALGRPPHRLELQVANELISDWKQQRDQLRIKIRLSNAELKEEFEKLEEQQFPLNQRFEPVAPQVATVAYGRA
jgi:hypothetical protein